MKRYILFAGESFYPNGGWEDYKQTSDSIEALLALIRVEKTYPNDINSYVYYRVAGGLTGDSSNGFFAHIVDIATCEIVKEYDTKTLTWKNKE